MKHTHKRSYYQLIRRASDRLCLSYGLPVFGERTGRRKPYTEYLDEKNGLPTYRSMIRHDVDRAMNASLTREEFFSALREMGYRLLLYDENRRPLEYPALAPPGSKGYFRFHRLANSGYSLDEILERVADNFRRRPLFPVQEIQKAEEYRKKLGPQVFGRGIPALYLRYCRELHVLQKYPAAVPRVSFFLREDLIRLSKLDRQTRLLSEKKIETVEDLRSFRKETRKQMNALSVFREHLKYRKRRAKLSGDPEEENRIREEIHDLTLRMKDLRQDLRLTEDIEERSKQMEKELSDLTAQIGRENGKGGMENERSYGRRGGSGREDVPGRD